MEEKKSFFGGLRRGQKEKETNNAVSSNEEMGQIIPAEDEAIDIADETEIVSDAENTTTKPDQITDINDILDFARPNETLGDLLADVRKMSEIKDDSNKPSEQSLAQESAPLSSQSETVAKEVSLGDIIAEIRSKSEEKQGLNELKPRDENASFTLVAEEFLEDPSDEMPDDLEDEQESRSHLNSLIQSIQNKPPGKISDEVPEGIAYTKSSHLSSLIADIQEDTNVSAEDDYEEMSENETGKKIDRIINQLLTNREGTLETDYFSDRSQRVPSGNIDSLIRDIQHSETSDKGISSQLESDDFIDGLVDVYDEAYDEAEPDESTPSKNSTTRITRIIEEVSIEGNKKIRKEDIKIKPDTTESSSVPPTKEWRKKGGIISAEEAASYSDLILSGGAELDLEDFHLSDRAYNFEMDNRKEILAALDGIVGGDVDKLDLSKLKQTESTPEETKELDGKKKKIGQGLFGRIMGKSINYDPAIHGSLVNIPQSTDDGIEEIELYPVNEPYAYIRIIFNHNTHEYLYTVIEPELSDGENLLVQELTERLFETLDINTKDLTKERACAILTDAVDHIIFDYGIKLAPISREKILYHIHKNFIGDGRIDAIMHDKYIEDISCDGINAPLFVYHSNYESIQTNLVYTRAEDLDSFVTKLAQRAGKYISIAEPMLDATMADGSRIQMTLGFEVTAHGSTFTIRKFKDEPITPTDLIEWGTYSPLSVAFLWLAVENGKSCIFAGGTASGKTTSLNAISLFIPPLAKIVTLEDTRELKLPHKNWIPSITRESFDKDGKGSIDMYELLRAALRQRPEYILVGEVRGKEAQTLFQAMSTGHVTYATTHADSVASVVHRFENPPMNVPRNMLSALDLVSIQVQARFGGQRIRRNKTLIEILDIDPRTNELITNEVFKWNAATDEIRFSGKSYILEDIMEGKGWNDARMREELKRRQEILEWMRLKKIRHFQEVGKVLLSYYRNPESVMELVRSDLYE